MNRIRATYAAIVAFFLGLFGRTAQGAEAAGQQLMTATAGVTADAPPRKHELTPRLKRQRALRLSLRRHDGGGKHYGSKRRISNHRGSGSGKRSGRA